MAKRVFWTDKEIEILAAMAKAGRTASEITKVLKSRTESSILLKARRLQILLKGPEPDIDMDEYKRLMRSK